MPLHTIGTVRDQLNRPIPVVVDGGWVRLPGFRLGPEQADELAELLITALWQAERNAAALAKASSDA